MNFRTLLTGLLLFPLLTFSQHVENVRTDPDNALGGSVSQLFDSVNYIPLETKKESIFGQIDKLIVTDEYFFILDHSMDQILIFRKNGRFHAKVQMQRIVKTNNIEGLGINTFAVDAYNKHILVNHRTRQESVFFFSYDGVFIKEQRGLHLELFGAIDSSNYLVTALGDMHDDKGGFGNYAVMDTGLTYFRKFLFSKQPNIRVNIPGSISQLPGKASVIMSRPYDYSIYEVAAEGVQQQLKLTFPMINTLPSYFFDSAFVDKQAVFLRTSDHKAVLGLVNLLASGNTLAFSLFSLRNFYPGAYIYSKRSGNLYAVRNISTDSAHHFLPCVGMGGAIAGADQTAYYAEIPAYHFLARYEENAKNRNLHYPAEIKALYQSLKRNSNAVIIKLKPKVEI